MIVQSLLVLMQGFRKLRYVDFSTSYSITGGFLRSVNLQCTRLFESHSIFLYFGKDSSHFKWIQFMAWINYYKSKVVSGSMSFKMLNDVALCTLLDIGNKILTVKCTFRILFLVFESSLLDALSR